MRSFWAGALTFGLVNIPVRAYVATDEHALDFDMLHKKDLSPIRYARICKAEEKEVPYSEIVKGYEYEKGHYVVVEPEDFKKANAKKTSTLEILSFAQLEEINPLLFERPYYLEPDKKAAKAYALFCQALKRSNKVAITTFVFHHKEHVGVIRAQGNMLILLQLRYASQLRPADQLSIPEKVTASSQELEMALTLMEELSQPFHAEAYKDTYSEELKATIEGKLKGEKKAGTRKKETMRSGDLMHLLKASLHHSLKEEKPRKKKAAPAPKSSKKRKRI